MNGNLIPHDFYIGPAGGAVDSFTFPMLPCIEIDDEGERKDAARKAGYADGFDLDASVATPSRMAAELAELAARENDARHHYETLNIEECARLLGNLPIETAYAAFKSKVVKLKATIPGWDENKMIHHEEKKILSVFAGYVAGFAAGRADRIAADKYRDEQLAHKSVRASRWA